MDVGILDNPRVDTLVAIGFLELMYSVKYAIFSTNEDLQELGSSDLVLFEEYLKEPDGSVMQPVILTVIAITSNHLDKTIIQLGKGTYIKGQDKDLSEWLLAAVNRSDNIILESVIKMIRNWNDSKNEIFDFRPSSSKALNFKNSKRD